MSGALESSKTLQGESEVKAQRLVDLEHLAITLANKYSFREGVRKKKGKVAVIEAARETTEAEKEPKSSKLRRAIENTASSLRASLKKGQTLIQSAASGAEGLDGTPAIWTLRIEQELKEQVYIVERLDEALEPRYRVLGGDLRGRVERSKSSMQAEVEKLESRTKLLAQMTEEELVQLYSSLIQTSEAPDNVLRDVNARIAEENSNRSEDIYDELPPLPMVYDGEFLRRHSLPRAPFEELFGITKRAVRDALFTVNQLARERPNCDVELLDWQSNPAVRSFVSSAWFLRQHNGEEVAIGLAWESEFNALHESTKPQFESLKSMSHQLRKELRAHKALSTETKNYEGEYGRFQMNADRHAVKGGDTRRPKQCTISFPGSERGVLFAILTYSMKLKSGSNGDFHAMNDASRESRESDTQSAFPAQWKQEFGDMSSWKEMQSVLRKHEYADGTGPHWFIEEWGPAAYFCCSRNSITGSGVVILKSWKNYVVDARDNCKLEFYFCRCLAKRYPRSVYVVDSAYTGHYMSSDEDEPFKEVVEQI